MRCMFVFLCCHHHRDLHSFPTRRSSDLSTRIDRDDLDVAFSNVSLVFRLECAEHSCLSALRSQSRKNRSEEHTSELQSHSDLVCRLLLEKKKKTTRRSSGPGPDQQADKE